MNEISFDLVVDPTIDLDGDVDVDPTLDLNVVDMAVKGQVKGGVIVYVAVKVKGGVKDNVEVNRSTLFDVRLLTQAHWM